jgi:hypothetical protein
MIQGRNKHSKNDTERERKQESMKGERKDENERQKKETYVKREGNKGKCVKT